jgi:UDP-glucose 4-epimerase
MNLGSEKGFSVLEVIAATERVCGKPIERRVAPRRAGDAPILVASSQKARKTLGWNPVESDLESIIGSAWRWARQRANVTGR